MSEPKPEYTAALVNQGPVWAVGVYCCDEMRDAIEDQVVLAPPFWDYFATSGGGYDGSEHYYRINFCPFCGTAVGGDGDE